MPLTTEDLKAIETLLDERVHVVIEAALKPAIDAALKPAIDAVLKPAIDAVLKPALDAALGPAISQALEPIAARLSALERANVLRRESIYRKGLTRYQLRQHLSEDYRTFHDLVGNLPPYAP